DRRLLAEALSGPTLWIPPTFRTHTLDNRGPPLFHSHDLRLHHACLSCHVLANTAVSTGGMERADRRTDGGYHAGRSEAGSQMDPPARTRPDSDGRLRGSGTGGSGNRDGRS